MVDIYWIDTLRVHDLPLDDMIRKPDEEQRIPPLQWLPARPMQPGGHLPNRVERLRLKEVTNGYLPDSGAVD